MRRFLASFWSTAALLSAGLVSAAVADEIAVHLPEDAPAGQAVADLRVLLQLAPTEGVRLGVAHRDCFRIDSSDRLVVAPRARLDHESRPEHRLTLQIVNGPDGRTEGDSLQSRFSELITEQAAKQPPDDSEAATARTVSISVFVDDVPEPPLLLGSRFRLPQGATPQAGQRIGRAIVIDRDRQEQHHFELLEGGAFLRIDSETGELFLREEMNPLSVSTLRAVVRVTDHAGLSAQSVYAVLLNHSPPAPPLPVLLAETTLPAEYATPKDSAPGTTTPPESTEPHDTAETIPTAQVAAGSQVRPKRTAPFAPQASRRSAQPAGSTGLSWTRGLLSLFGAETFEEHRSEWLIVAAVAMCVVVIILSGLRNVVLAGRQSVDTSSEHKSASVVQPGQTRHPASEQDPQEISEILERLDAVIGRSEHAAGDVEDETLADPQTDTETSVGQPSAGDAAPDADPHAVSDAKSGGAMVATSTTKTPLDQPAEASAVAPSAARSAPQKGAGTAAAPVVVLHVAPPSQRSVAMTDDERARIEQFREISRMMNRADIGRHYRERLRDEWASVGVTALACVVTGTVCVFTSCFGAMSVPIGSVMFSVATALLMRPSLYPQLPAQQSAETSRGDRHAARAK